MNDEINKIIQSISDFYKLDNALKYYLDRHKAHLLLDYITNLQEEKEDYKSRCEKAIKYINNQICVYYVLDRKLNQLVDKTNIVKEDLLNILNGGDEE